MQSKPLALLPCFLVVVLLAALLPACQRAYYNTMEKFGVHKRDILVERVHDGRDAQRDAKEEILDALEAFKNLTGFEGGEFETVYDKLREKYESSARAVDTVKKRIAKIEDVSSALFSEWSGEIAEMQDRELKDQSKRLLDQTRARYDKVIQSMRTAQTKMDPVVTRLKDHVLFLKHNLNARAVASLQKNLVAIEGDVALLVADMEKAIAEADAFIAAMSE